MNTAFFVASKVLWFLTDPGNILLFLIIAGVLLSMTRWKKAGRWIASLGAIFAMVIFIFPIGSYGLRYLENRFPVNPPLPEAIAGIIVLGGALDPFVTEARGQLSINGNAERITIFSELALRYPRAKLIYSGGSGLLTDQSLKEADYLAPILKQLGVNTQKILLESESRNTFENAVLSYELANPGPDETWILITSAFHMPRSLGCFRKAGWPNIIPYPVDFIFKGNETLAPPLSLTTGLSYTSNALHEWLGLMAYYLTGKTDALLPAP